MYKPKRILAGFTIFLFIFALVPMVQAQYEGENGTSYTDDDFKSDQTQITVTSNDGYATFCWEKPSTYFEGYAIYAKEGRLEDLTNYTPEYQNRDTNCYTYPKQFNYNASVSVHVYAYIALKSGARKFIQPGYETSQTVLAEGEERFFSPIQLTASSENNMIKLDWDPLPGLGTDFDKYNVMFKKGSYSNLTGDYAKSYVDWDYYNLAGLATGEEWTFQVVPVKKQTDGKYKVVGERSAVVTVMVKGKTDSVNQTLGPVTLTGEGVEGGVEMKWNELPGMGTKFDRYGLIWQEGYVDSLNGSVARGAVLHNYYNLKGLKNNTYYTFQVVPVKVVDGRFIEVGHRSKTVQVKTLGGSSNIDIPTIPEITQPEQNAVLTNFPRYAFLVWTPVASVDYYEIELACDVCVSSSEKWLKPSMYKTKFNSFTTPALAGDNEFRFRVKAIGTSGKTGEWSDYRYFSYKTKSEPKVETDSISLAITGWKNGLPTIKWTEYKGQPFDGYAVFVRKGTWNKDQVTWVDPFYFSKDVTSYQLVKMLPNTDYTVRIVAYAQTVTGKQMLYPASNVISFKTQEENTTVAVDKTMSCGNSAGDDGLYSACKGDSIDHDLSGLTATVLKYNSRYVKLALDSADKRVIVVRMGKTKTVLTDTDMRVTFKYTQISDKFGAFIQITSVE